MVIRLHVDGWNAKSIAGYLDVSRKTVHEILQRFAEEQFAGLEDKSHARKKLRKVDFRPFRKLRNCRRIPCLGRIASVRPLNKWASSFLAPPVGAIFPLIEACITSRSRPTVHAQRQPCHSGPSAGIKYGVLTYVTWICIVYRE